MVDLSQQLKMICRTHLNPIENVLDENKNEAKEFVHLPPPTEVEETALRQILMTGFCDSIAKKLPVGIITEGSRRRKLTAYISCDPSEI
jgi:hypothetical protein